jgi:hypothetical protein
MIGAMAGGICQEDPVMKSALRKTCLPVMASVMLIAGPGCYTLLMSDDERYAQRDEPIIIYVPVPEPGAPPPPHPHPYPYPPGPLPHPAPPPAPIDHHPGRIPDVLPTVPAIPPRRGIGNTRDDTPLSPPVERHTDRMPSAPAPAPPPQRNVESERGGTPSAPLAPVNTGTRPAGTTRR